MEGGCCTETRCDIIVHKICEIVLGGDVFNAGDDIEFVWVHVNANVISVFCVEDGEVGSKLVVVNVVPACCDVFVAVFHCH